MIGASKAGFTAIHAAAETGQLSTIPVEHLTADLLLTRNDNGDTPLHAAAYEGHLDQVPSELLTAINISVRNYDGVSVWRTACDRNFEKQIPAAARPRNLGPIDRFFRRIFRARSNF